MGLVLVLFALRRQIFSVGDGSMRLQQGEARLRSPGVCTDPCLPCVPALSRTLLDGCALLCRAAPQQEQ